jgi:hypothetical protein
LPREAEVATGVSGAHELRNGKSAENAMYFLPPDKPDQYHSASRMPTYLTAAVATHGLAMDISRSLPTYESPTRMLLSPGDGEDELWNKQGEPRVIRASAPVSITITRNVAGSGTAIEVKAS